MNNPRNLPAEIVAALEATAAIGRAINELPGGIPSGELYARVMSALPNLDAAGWEKMINLLVLTKIIRREGQMLFGLMPKG
jgi:hypothetical protein